MEYYKKIDKSFFDGKTTIPEQYVPYFIEPQNEMWGSSRKVKIKFQGKDFDGNYCFVSQSSGRRVFQISFEGALVKALKNEFIQSYFVIESQKLLKKENSKFHTSIVGGNQEVVIFKPISNDEVELVPFIKVPTSYDNIFKKFVEANVFGWLSNESSNQMITKYSSWIDIGELNQHVNQNHVVYYLVDDNKKQIYIGSAKVLGSRVKPGRSEIPGWNKFMYAIVHPDFHAHLKEIEYHTINSFARFFANNGKKSTLSLSEYTLVNKDYKYYRD